MQWFIQNYFNIFGTLIGWSGIAIAGLMGYNDRELYWVLIPMVFTTCGFLMQRSRMQKAMEKIGNSTITVKYILQAAFEQSILPLVAYLIFYFIF